MKVKNLLIFLIMSVVLGTSCNNKSKQEQDIANNPLIQDYDTPFNVPPFDKIEKSDFLPAIKEGIKVHNEEIDAIVNNPEAPNFENTILAYDKSGELLDKTLYPFYCLLSAETDDELQNLAYEISPMLSEHSSSITLNDGLFQRIKTVYETRFESNLNSNQIRCVEKYFDDFSRNGANLSPEDKEELKKVNATLSKLYLQFDDNVLKENNTFKMYLTEEDLAGLPQNVIDAAALAAKNDGNEGKYLFTLHKPSMIPFLQFSDRRDLREEIYTGYFTRGNHDNEYDNKDLILEIMKNRIRKAELLGFNHFADYRISNNMAKDYNTVHNFINDIWTPALNVAKIEAKELQAMMDLNSADKNLKLEPWDWWYYSEKVRKHKYDLDESQLKPYFSLDNVRDGMFYVSNKLYGINFSKLENIPVYHPAVEVFEIKDENNKHIGLLYLDYFPRPGKGQGAWCSSLRSAGMDKEGNRMYPIITITCNFTQPTGNIPALLTLDEAETLFHEFGHGLHGLFSFNEYNRLSGDMPRDMVELPSQIMENWCTYPEVLKYYAKHYETGEAIPDELIKKIQETSTFNSGFETTELLAATLLDLEWNSLTNVDGINVNEFEKNYLESIGLIPEILPRYRSPYFAHIFTGEGYAAGYYVYTWAEVLDQDAFNAFEESGDVFNKELAEKFRKYVLTESGNDEPMKQYIKFRGQEPSNIPYLKGRGLLNK
ncbi:MAG: M3 family metallopeptidase [Bacteroidales bacterium]